MTTKIVSNQGPFERLVQKVLNKEVFTERELLDITIQLINENHQCSKPTEDGYPFTLIGYDRAASQTFMMKTYALDSLEATINCAEEIPCTVNSRTLQVHLPEGVIFIPD
jgi:hypothetical protein